jgi:hypothetical protein
MRLGPWHMRLARATEHFNQFGPETFGIPNQSLRFTRDRTLRCSPRRSSNPAKRGAAERMVKAGPQFEAIPRMFDLATACRQSTP